MHVEVGNLNDNSETQFLRRRAIRSTQFHQGKKKYSLDQA